MSVDLTLHWGGSVSASAFHTAEAYLRGRPLVDAALGQTISGPAQKLRQALDEEAIPADPFWIHLIALSAGGMNCQESARVTLVKTIGVSEARTRVPFFRDLLSDILHTFSAALPKLQEELDASIAPLRNAWNYQGTSLLARIVGWTEELIPVEEASVALVYPALGGGGLAHLPYNLARIEAVASDPVKELPEIVRLGWLLSMLNLDLPRYSENVNPKRLAMTAGLAMLPVTLKAASELSLARCDEETIQLAVSAWLPAVEDGQPITAALFEWWNTYCEMRPELPIALAALDRLIDQCRAEKPGAEKT